ncbi:hypothetical protein AMTRI_Chr13g124020 [Amborella trichopoda]|uniref:Uncharacterized protein n=1 Tax=Amborella trichopoda TaxID=13333 RepID=U5CWP2_AMBTC|nr:uncharacterized protein LOC18442636 [Amborella trichopoda]ERN14380.1 hypothetical protein AMTR_s00033p00228810 [Amborella trichopoda]|eukprot:XP_011626424.1 uncharacterized protein LOC18442636 [Amborella trichopoda]
MELETGTLVQGLVLIFALALAFLAYNFPARVLAPLRARGRSSAQAKRHFIQGAQLLAQARSAPSKKDSLSLARSSLNQADQALTLDPKDAAAHILKALGLQLLGQLPQALASLDNALSPPALKSLAKSERADALFKRAEIRLKMEPKSRHRAELAMADLLAGITMKELENSRVFCMLGDCYLRKEMVDEAKKAFENALRLEPSSEEAKAGLASIS